ncbi:hypothetical protein [Microbacterium sp. KNMS]
MSRSDITPILTEVIDAHAGHIGTHNPRCWRYHAGCLAVLIRDRFADVDDAELPGHDDWKKD